MADLVLIVHLLFVFFVLLGLILIPVGGALDWPWVRSFRLRVAHLASIVFVAAETAAGFACPLTIWEDALRGREGGTTFVQRLIHAVLFYDFPAWVFAAAYLAAAAYAIFLWKAVPPRRRP